MLMTLMMIFLMGANSNAGKKLEFDPIWMTCDVAADCDLTRQGTGCAWIAVNKTHIEDFRQWDGLKTATIGPNAGCQKALEIQERDMEFFCNAKKCEAALKKKAH